MQTIGGPSATGNGYAYGDDDPLDNLDPTGNSSCGGKSRNASSGKGTSRSKSRSPQRPASASASYPSYDYGHAALAAGGYLSWSDSYDIAPGPVRSGFSGPYVTEEGDVYENGRRVGANGRYFDDDLFEEFFGGGLLPESAQECEVPDEPHRPTAEDGINEKPVNERPSGQNTSPSQSGTKNGDSGPAVEPANTATEAEVNPAADGQSPFEGVTQSGGASSEPAADESRISGLSDDDRASIQNLSDAADRARDGTVDDIERTLTRSEFRQMERAFGKKQYWRVKQFFGKYMEKAIARDPSVKDDQNITRLGRPFQAEPDFQAGKFNIDITTDTEYSERVHLKRDYIDSKENLLTYRRLTVPEMIELFGEA